MKTEKVFFSHDGGLDDYLCVMLLMSLPHVETLGIVVTEADCYIDPAIGATRKILDLMGGSQVPVAASTVRARNPFPRRLRRTSWQIDNLPILNARGEVLAPLVGEPGQHYLARVLSEQDQPVTFLETGPLTTLSEALKIAPEAASKVSRILWMGGALHVPGNVRPHEDANIDGSMEWNVYWDPEAAHAIWQTEIPVVLCPLDITNTVPLTEEFMALLAGQYEYKISDLAGQAYALVRHQPYYMWDVLTTAYLAWPELFTLREESVEIIPFGASQGRTKPSPDGKRVQVLDTVDTARLNANLAAAWKRN
ncbi:MAG: nucleoside hydrolase [Anaerolineales bacterium]|nr:nucleoside hydrolase [Anaerolineales bacterium]